MKTTILYFILLPIFVAVMGGLILYYILGVGKKNFSSRFSSAQSIKILPPSLGGTDSLNLDNVARLQLYFPYDMNKVAFILNRAPVIELPFQSNEGFTAEGFKVISHKDAEIYTFSTAESIKEVKVGDRTFIVNLQSISKMNIENVSNAIEYKFGISEK